MPLDSLGCTNCGQRTPVLMKVSRQLVLVCIQCRKAWRLLQSKVGSQSAEYALRQAILADVDAGTLSMEEFLRRASELLEERLLALGPPPAARGARAPSRVM